MPEGRVRRRPQECIPTFDGCGSLMFQTRVRTSKSAQYVRMGAEESSTSRTRMADPECRKVRSRSTTHGEGLDRSREPVQPGMFVFAIRGTRPSSREANQRHHAD